MLLIFYSNVLKTVYLLGFFLCTATLNSSSYSISSWATVICYFSLLFWFFKFTISKYLLVLKGLSLQLVNHETYTYQMIESLFFVTFEMCSSGDRVHWVSIYSFRFFHHGCWGLCRTVGSSGLKCFWSYEPYF